MIPCNSLFLAYVQPCKEFLCKKSQKCIPKTWICDGAIDCGVDDDSDEAADCSTYSYLILSSAKVKSFVSTEKEHCDINSGRYFQCVDSEQCLPIASKCDGHKDCMDGSDERGCSCTCSEQFSCLTICQCLDVARVCDGVPDCIDQTDEHNCTCTSNEYTCLGGGCINRTQLCDGTHHCAKGDDEMYPGCSGRLPFLHYLIHFITFTLEPTTTPLTPLTTVGETVVPTLPIFSMVTIKMLVV